VWQGTWRPVTSAASVSVSIAASQTVAGTTLSSSTNGAAPVQGVVGLPTTFGGSNPIVLTEGVVQGATFRSVPVAPGSLVTVFGLNLAGGSQNAGLYPLPTTLGKTSVLMGATAMPILAETPTQVNVQVPFDVPVNSQVQVSVQAGNLLSVPTTLQVAAAQPGVFTKDQSGSGQGIITLGNTSTLAEPATPAKAGDTVVIYCTGLGAVDPPVVAGTAAATASATTNKVTVTIGGVPTPVSYSGVTPGFAGLYQINAVVPGNVSGDAVPVVVTVAGQTSPAVTMAVH
jgi:uncharacterized protein (TIGR03437 family)